jgi:predicted ester cyclase
MRNALHRGMSTHENRAIYERFVREVLEQGNLAAIDELVAESAREAITHELRAFHAAFADRTLTVRDTVAEADKVVGHFGVSALHQGDFLGMAATGERIEYSGMSFARLEHGKIAEHRSVHDTEPLRSAQPSLLELAQKDVARRFFAEYADRFNRSLAGEHVDAREVADSFADHFVEASPTGVNGGKNGMLFRWIIPSGFAHYRKLGTTSMNIENVEVETIDPMHALAKVHWDSSYTKKDGEHDHIEFDVTYLLHFQGAKPKIFAYITGDEEKVLRDHGLS